MDAAGHSSLSQLPDEMFIIIKAAAAAGMPRLGRLVLPGRTAIETPHYLASTSRGVVPHITQDNFARCGIDGVYVGLEDFIEKAPYKTPPLYTFKPPDGSSPLRRFIALPNETLLVLGARRTPPVFAPAANPNTNSTIQICTSVGFRPLQADDYAQDTESLKPDIIVGLGDVPYGRALGSKRMEKATDRSIDWVQQHARQSAGAKLFASLLPVSCANQQYYIDCLTDDVAGQISGLAFHTLDPLEDLPASLHQLPRLAFTEPRTPHHILQHISLGLDILTIPFITAATDAGIALDFSFPAPAKLVQEDAKPLGIDMWLPTHAVDLSPLLPDCKCGACSNHHRAYIQHLLVAKEMLGWVLLQLHNHYVIDAFFSGIRRIIADGAFQDEVARFEKTYEAQLPEKTGQGPRIRGYHFKSEGPNEKKKNKAPFTMLDGGEQNLAESTPPSAATDAEELEEQGFAEPER